MAAATLFWQARRMNRVPTSAREKTLASFGVASLAALTVIVVLGMGNAPVRKAPVAESAAAKTDAAPLPGFAPPAPPVDEGPLRYDAEYPTIPYSTGNRTDAVARLVARMKRGDLKLDYRAPRGYLDSLLAALDIDPASQTLVFSQTSLQSRSIRPSTPRAIYFNDDVYVGWVQHGPIEIASQDPTLGARVLSARADRRRAA